MADVWIEKGLWINDLAKANQKNARVFLDAKAISAQPVKKVLKKD